MRDCRAWSRDLTAAPTLAGVCQAIVDCPHRTAPTRAWGIPQIRTTDIKNGRLDLQGAKRVSEETYREWIVRAEPQAGDLILAREAPVGEVGIVPPDHRVCQGQRTVLLRPDPHQVVPRYLLYLMLTPGMRKRMLALAEGSTTPHLNVADVRRLRLPELPPIERQRRVADLLGALDDKIELNGRMNETLEASARALFKSWFVDFDPIRARMEGRDPFGMSAATASQFPDSLDESALGEIPRRWTIGSVRDLVSLSRESVDPADSPAEVFDHFSIPAFDDGRVPDAEQGSKIRSRKFVLGPGVVLLSKLNPRLPRVWLPFPSPDRRSIASTEFLVAVARLPFSREYVYSIFRSDEFIERFSGLVTGTSGSHQRVQSDDFLDMPVVLPDTSVVEVFTSMARLLFEKVAADTRESQSLAATRDTLLPHLISGDARDSD